MYTKWTSHLSDPEEKARFEQQIIGNKAILQRQEQLIKEDLASLDRVELSVKQFESPNWQERQIWYNASRATYNAILKLIDLDQQDTTNERKLTRYSKTPAFERGSQ